MSQENPNLKESISRIRDVKIREKAANTYRDIGEPVDLAALIQLLASRDKQFAAQSFLFDYFRVLEVDSMRVIALVSEGFQEAESFTHRELLYACLTEIVYWQGTNLAQCANSMHSFLIEEVAKDLERPCLEDSPHHTHPLQILQNMAIGTLALCRVYYFPTVHNESFIPDDYPKLNKDQWRTYIKYIYNSLVHDYANYGNKHAGFYYAQLGVLRGPLRAMLPTA